MFLNLFLFLTLFYKISCQTTRYIPSTTPTLVLKNCSLNGLNQWITLDGNTCYYFSSYQEKVTWHDANEACQRKGAQLLSIHDKATNQLFSNMSRKLYPNYYNMMYWIGLNALAQRGVYKWSDGSVYNFAQYPYNGVGTNIPTLPTYDYYTQGRCNYYYSLYAYNSQTSSYDSYGYWYYDDCNNVHQYICAKSITTSSPPTTTPTPPGNCPQGWYQFDNKKCIKIVNSSLTFSGALKRCDAAGSVTSGELVNIHSAKEQYYITALIAGLPSPFIGLKRPTSTNRWSWTDQSNLSYANWGVINNYNYQLMCGVISTIDTKAGSWIPVDCDSPHTFICEKPKESGISSPPPNTFSSCSLFPGMNKFIQYRNSCYYISDAMDTWDHAVGQCQTMSDSHLVSILNGFEYSFLMYYTMQYSQSNNYWIGFFSKNADGVNTPQAFEWIDTYPNYYTHWDDNEPKFNVNGTKVCVYQTKVNGTWKTSDCNQKRTYICKKTLDKVIEVNYTLGKCPNNTLSDPLQSWVDLDKHSKNCYWFSMDLKNSLGQVTWPDASFHCRQRNGSLATIHSEHDLSIMRNKISGASYNTWIGLFQLPGGAYGWDDGSSVDFTNWDMNNDDDLNIDETDTCIEIQASDLRWHKVKCSGYSGYKYYVCQTPKIFTISSIPPSQSTTPSSELSSGAKAGIIISVLLAVAVIGVAGFYAIRKYKVNLSSSSSFDNSMYANNRANTSTGTANNDEPKVTFSKIENNMVFH